MQIKNIKVTNFKSFDELNLDLGRFNVLIGANASGKSNFLSIFSFLKDICENDLEDAISLQGGVSFIKNINIGRTKNLSIEILFDSSGDKIRILKKEKEISIQPSEWFYKFCIEFLGGKRYKVVKEHLEVNFDFLDSSNGEKAEKEKKKSGKFTFDRDNDKYNNVLDAEGISLMVEDVVPSAFSRKRFLNKELSIEFPISLFHLLLRNYCKQISLYDFDPKLSKEAISITGKTELESDGNNLAVVLKNIVDEKQKNEKFHDLIKDLLPYIDEIKVPKLADKYLLTSLKEVFSEKKFFAPLISDGTINVTALIIALYFEKKPVIMIEEPERNIHPYLISKLINMMKDVSENMKRQIVVTTHNPEVVRHVNEENISLIRRDDVGFSQIICPVEQEEVKTFLKNDMGMDELYVQNLLEW